jgi:hypothetical protein
MVRLATILNIAAVILSLTLVALSIAALYLTGHGTYLMDNAFPPGKYEWYRGPSYDLDTKHKITLQYNSANEGVLLAAGAVSCLTGLVGVVKFLFTLKVNNPYLSWFDSNGR